MANIAFNDETGEAVRFDPTQNKWIPTQIAVNDDGIKRVGWDGSSWVGLPDVRQEPTFMGDIGRSVMRGKQQLDIATTVLGRELGLYSDEEAAKSIASDVAESAKYQPSKRLKGIREEAEQDKSFGDVLKRYADRPIYDSLRYVTSIVAESLVPSLVAGGAGAAAGAVAGSAVPVVGTGAGAAAGLGVGSAAIEYASTILDKLQDAGVNINDPKAVQAFLSDPEKMAAARQSGLLRGIPIGVVDAVTAGAAGRFIAPLRAAEEAGAVVSRGKKLAAGAKEMGLQMAGGAGGEMAAGLLEKGEISPKAAFDEAIAELPSGLLEMAIGIKVRNRKGASTNPADLSPTDIEEAIRTIKADQEKEAASFADSVSKMGIPADVQNAILDLGDKVWAPNTEEQDINEAFNKIKEQYPELANTLDKFVPTLTRLRTRADAVSKFEGVSEAGKKGRKTSAASDMEEALSVPSGYEERISQQMGLERTAGAVTSEEEALSAERQRQQLKKSRDEFERSQRERFQEGSGVPFFTEEQLAESEATSREAQRQADEAARIARQNAEDAAAGPYKIKEIPKKDGTSAYQILDENGKVSKTAIQTRPDAERQAAELNREKQAIQNRLPKTETPPPVARQLGITPEKTPTKQLAEAAQKTQEPVHVKSASNIKNVIDGYIGSLEGKKPEANLLQQYVRETTGIVLTKSQAEEEIKARSTRPFGGRKSELSIDSVLSPPSSNPTYNTGTTEAKDLINKYLDQMSARGKQGELSAQALREAIFDKGMNADQAITALKIIKGVERIMGKATEKNPVAFRFLREGDTIAQRQEINDGTVNSLLQFSLSENAMNAAGQNYAHEAMHVLQDLFKQVDPEAHRVLSKVFKKGMTLNDVPRNIVDFLKRRENPYTGKSYWDAIEKTIGAAKTDQERDEMEIMSYVFGAINEIMETNPKFIPPIGGAFVRFARFIGNALRSIRDSVFGNDGARALDIMKETASGYRGTQFKEAETTKPSSTRQSELGSVVSKEDAFNKLASDQRGWPESAMRDAQGVMGGYGIYSHAIEHAGDITHRISEYGGQLSGQGKGKVIDVLYALRGTDRDYTFRQEHELNIKRKSDHDGVNPKELSDKFDSALKNYANEHKKLEVYNTIQDHAREAAISLGEKNPEKAKKHLEAIERSINNGMYDKQVQEYNPNYQRRIHPDIKKESGRESQLSIERQSRMEAESIRARASSQNMEQAKGFRQRIANFIRMADPLHGVPMVDTFRIYKYIAHGKIAKIKAELDKLIPVIEKAKADKENIFKFMTTKNANPSMIRDQAARDAAIKSKRIINTIGDELFNRGLITQAEREKYGDAYLPRLFSAYINNRKLVSGLKIGTMPYLEMRKDLPDDRLIQLGEIRDPAFLITEAIFRPLRDMHVIDFYQKLNDQTGAKWVIGLDKVNYNGEKLNAAELYNRIGYLQDMLEHNQIAPDRIVKTNEAIADMKKVADNLMNEVGKDIDIKKYKKIPDTKHYGPLRGMWVMNQIYDDVMSSGMFYPTSPDGFINSVSEFSRDINTWFKQVKVTLNPPTIATNIISNIIMMSFADVALHRIPMRIGQTIQDFINKGELYKLSKKYDMESKSMSESELKHIYDEMKKRHNDGSGLTASFDMISSTLKALGKKTNKISDLYGTIETIFKMAIVNDAMKSQGLTEEQAVLKANKYLFDYSETHPVIRTLRNMPLGAPFITWTYKMIPLMLETAVLKPWKFAPIAGMYAGLAFAAEKALEDAGADPEDRKRYANYLSKAGRENMLAAPTGLAKRYILGQKGMDDVSLSYTNLGKFLPIDPFFRIFNAASSGDPKTILKEGFGALGGPTSDALYAIFTGKDLFTNRDIVTKGASPLEKAGAVANFAANEMLPPVLKDFGKMSASYITGDAESKARSEGLVVNAIKKAFGEEIKVKQGLPEKSASELLANFFGIVSYNPSIMQFSMNLKKFDSEVKDLEAELRRDIQDPRITNEDKRKITMHYSEKIKEKKLEQKKFIESSGLSPKGYELLRKSLES